MNHWKKITIFLLFLMNATNTLAIPKELDKITAIVNNGIILQSDVNTMVKIIKRKIKNSKKQVFDENTLRLKTLDRLITDKIIMQIAEKMQIQIPEETIDIAIANIAKQKKLTLTQLQQKLMINGIKFQNYRNNIRQKIMIAEVENNEVRRRINILPQELDSLITQLNLQSKNDTNVNLGHIMIPLEENASDSEIQLALNKANKTILQLKKGADFNKIAITYSPYLNGLKREITSWHKIEELPDIFFRKIKNAKKGDIIGPIRSNIGFHILKLNDIQHGKRPILVTEVKIRHILIKTSPITNIKKAYEKIQQIAQEIKTGQITFTEAAKKYSQDSNSASHGGSLDWNMLNLYDPVFYDSLIHLNKGEISRPIPSSFGWHLVQLEDTRQIDKTYATQKDQAYRLLLNRKFNKEAKLWIQEIRASSYIKVLTNTNPH